jgi:hypothetical protein
VTLNGYGCTALSEANPNPTLRFADTTTQPMSELTKYAFTDSDVSVIEASYSLTVATSTTPSICPGDSGGPVYRKGTPIIVGVNSTSIPGENGKPTFDWYPRLDGKARFGIAQWLEGLGVTMTSRCTPTSCVSVSDG